MPSDAEWRKVKPFRKTDRARLRYLEVAEAQKLIAACTPDFRALVQAALQTGCRYSELTRLTVADFDPAAGTLHIRQSKSGHPRHVVLTEEGVTLFRQLTAGQPAKATILCKADGTMWRYADQRKPMLDAVKAAKFEPISFHGLRHAWASLAVMGKVPLVVVAAQAMPFGSNQTQDWLCQSRAAVAPGGILPPMDVAATATTVIRSSGGYYAPGPCGGRGAHQVCGPYGNCRMVCNY